MGVRMLERMFFTLEKILFIMIYSCDKKHYIDDALKVVLYLLELLYEILTPKTDKRLSCKVSKNFGYS